MLSRWRKYISFTNKLHLHKGLSDRNKGPLSRSYSCWMSQELDLLSHRTYRHRDNGSDQGLSPWSPISLFTLSPYNRLRGVDPTEMKWNEERPVGNQPIQEHCFKKWLSRLQLGRVRPSQCLAGSAPWPKRNGWPSHYQASHLLGRLGNHSALWQKSWNTFVKSCSASYISMVGLLFIAYL